MMPRPLQILEPTWLSTAPSAIPLIVLPNATMTWFSVPRWPNLNCLEPIREVLESDESDVIH